MDVLQDIVENAMLGKLIVDIVVENPCMLQIDSQPRIVQVPDCVPVRCQLQ